MAVVIKKIVKRY